MKVELDLDEKTYDTVRRLANELHVPLAQVIARLAVHAEPPPAKRRSILGLLASDADLLETVCEEAMTARETTPWRMCNDGA